MIGAQRADMAILRAEQHLAVPPAGHAVIDDQRPDDSRGVERAIGNRFGHIDIAAMPLHALPRIAAVPPDMPACACFALADGVIGRRLGQDFAPGERRQAGLALERGDRIVERGDTLACL
jgi:hypothetical protein